MVNHDSSIADVLKEALRDAQELVRSEIALARAEARDEVRRVGSGAALLAGAAIAGVIAAVLFLTTVAWAIPEATGWPVWSGFAIVTLLALLTAGALALIGRTRLIAGRHMPRTVDTLKENVQWMRARTS